MEVGEGEEGSPMGGRVVEMEGGERRLGSGGTHLGREGRED